jgi:enoyl-[acyl-carrier protein] reductase I
MSLLNGKVGVVFGVANKRSIAWGICKAVRGAGSRLALNYQNERMESGVRELAAELEDPWLGPCDVMKEAEIDTFFQGVKQKFGGIDFLVHSIAFAKREELGGSFVDTSLDGYLLAQQVSVYSLVALARRAAPLMEGRGGSILTLSYYGAEKVVPNYNVMGVAKAALEATVRYLANDLGPKGIRVNAISAGPIKTLSAMGVADFSSILEKVAQKAPLRRTVTTEDVGHAGLFLLSPMANGVTGQVLYVDAGYSIMGM